ncbi:chalcone isomerase family protein [Pseudomonas sp. NKUCC02_KPG]|uniref:chalcone isomerase family protein n=1 Tax=Pseudomonas sp. NKUCC02_KPG TaxID=2842124 RepID=UPI001C5AA409|nr:chalcone isomerase family protein [Pseudomonas sp. NKUCC02_KPG]MBW3505848.1 chalcone isomerase family protein [Pseudomonas sp. NKUCC02_KPG]
MRKLLIVLLLLHSAASPADETARFKEANFPALAQANTTPMVRKGQIVLTYLWADIYAAALFTPPGISPEQAFNEQRDLRLELFYLRDLDHSDITQASATILKRQHPATTLANLDAPLKKLQASFGNIKRGDRYALDYNPQRGLNVERNGAVIFNSQNQELAKVYLGIWLAPQGLPDKLRLALLAQEP